jgi:hypothetical protein
MPLTADGRVQVHDGTSTGTSHEISLSTGTTAGTTGTNTRQGAGLQLPLDQPCHADVLLELANP